MKKSVVCVFLSLLLSVAFAYDCPLFAVPVCFIRLTDTSLNIAGWMTQSQKNCLVIHMERTSGNQQQQQQNIIFKWQIVKSD